MLYACFTKGTTDLKSVEAELQYSIEKAYDLYNSMLLFMIELKHYAELRNEMLFSRLGSIGEENTVHPRFLTNLLITRLEENDRLKRYAEEKGLIWTDHQGLLKSVFNKMMISDYYEEYIKSEATDLEADKIFWRKLLKNEILDNPDFEVALEDMSIYWMDDFHVIFSFVLKTIKQLGQETDSNEQLLPMFKNEEDREYAIKLVDRTVTNSSKLDDIIAKYLINWELDRIAFMDTVILKTAIAELLYFPTIPIKVTLNEYIDIAKYYSSPKSSKFINGILDRVVCDYKKEIMKG